VRGRGVAIQLEELGRGEEGEGLGCDIGRGVAVGRLGLARGRAREERRAESILVGVEEDTGRVIVTGTAVRLEGEDVGADEGLEGKVRRVRRAGGFEAENGHCAGCLVGPTVDVNVGIAPMLRLYGRGF
jgi:hypothetical protein